MTDRGQIAVSEAAREIEKLMGLHPKGYDLSLDRIRRLLEALGNPERNLPPVIHIAGTNGKGSTSAFCRAPGSGRPQRPCPHLSTPRKLA